MVSTRHHPREFPSPEAGKELTKLPPTSANSRKWTHTPAAALTIWLIVSVPLVIWDTGYVLLRPYSMPGGSLHSPIWTPYALYGKVDYIYGWPAFNAHNGFTAAQTTLNIFETIGYIYYLWIVYRYGSTVGRGGSQKISKGFTWLLKGDKVVAGRIGATALLVAYTASVMTLSKTILYWLNESFSGFENIGHNEPLTLFLYWILPNGMWLVFPSYNIYILGGEILNSLELATPRQKVGRPKST
ncbi:Emopamil-binding [Penicillium expansum]|nr:Emopamil-binding [Penicillium expansum]